MSIQSVSGRGVWAAQAGGRRIVKEPADSSNELGSPASGWTAGPHSLPA